MVMSSCVRVGSIAIGCSLLVLTLISVICGSVAMSKISSAYSGSIGLWGFYFAIPGVLNILAGCKKQSNLLGVALATHILGIILAIVGMSLGALFWFILSSSCVDLGFPSYHIGYCACWYHNKLETYSASCSDLKTVREATAAVTIAFALIAIVSFVGSIYGCIGTCCSAPQGPTHVIVTTAQQPNTIVMSTAQTNSAYNQQPPPLYGQPAGQGQMVIDTKP